jgi:hypothetical protein
MVGSAAGKVMALLTLAAAVLWHAARLEALCRVVVFQRATVSHAVLSGKLLLCHLVGTSKNVEAINF